MKINIQEFVQRRKTLMSQCLDNSLVIVPAAALKTRSNDTEYHFRQDSYFWYLSAFNEPDAYLLLSNRLASDGETMTSFMFLQPKDKLAEIWQGRRLGVDAALDTLQLNYAYSINELNALLPEIIDGHEHLYFSVDHNQQANKLVKEAMAKCKSAPKQQMLAPRCIHDVNHLIDAMRLIKSDTEIELMQKAADIACDAHTRAMKASKAGIWEYQLEAEILHEFAMQGARFAAYNTIVGGGENACILHYTENSEQIQDGDLVLIDAGCEYQGYASDITRTFPVNGRFSEAQKEIYQLVLDAQLASIDVLKEGTTISQAMMVAVEIISKGLLKYGVLKGNLDEVLKNESWRNFFMHGLGHYLGLDVHDVGIYKKNGQDLPLKTGIVMTVEPGIYIPSDADVPEQYKGIGVRIEDNVLIQENGAKVLTDKVVKDIADIEALMGAA